MACFLSLQVLCVRRGVAPPGASGTVRVPTAFCCRLRHGATHIIAASCQRRAPRRVLPVPPHTHLGQAGEVFILVLLQLRRKEEKRCSPRGLGGDEGLDLSSSKHPGLFALGGLGQILLSAVPRPMLGTDEISSQCL